MKDGTCNFAAHLISSHSQWKSPHPYKCRDPTKNELDALDNGGVQGTLEILGFKSMCFDQGGCSIWISCSWAQYSPSWMYCMAASFWLCFCSIHHYISINVLLICCTFFLIFKDPASGFSSKKMYLDKSSSSSNWTPYLTVMLLHLYSCCKMVVALISLEHTRSYHFEERWQFPIKYNEMSCSGSLVLSVH